MVDRVEFAAYVEAQAVKQGTSSKPLTAQQLYQLGLRAGIGESTTISNLTSVNMRSNLEFVCGEGCRV